ncbi:MAG: flavin reductase [Methanobrevibacter ruminantium]|uniref:flavin reductase family protein n=1 Tax=Methanobrevibacter ruminantium TaxID=83816 RepID=UPI0026EC2B86|nr:flavin reductase [Methanobrevibacter ruminantium]MDD6048253.1 flavin reductase [Methanobrevibacter ruminantium]
MSGKVNLKPRTMMYPSPAVIASAYDEYGKADACTLAFAAMCSHQPPAVMIAINSTAKRKTLKSILEREEFVLGFPTVDQVAETDYIGMASGYDVDKLEKVGFTTTKTKEVNAPIINEMK